MHITPRLKIEEFEAWLTQYDKQDNHSLRLGQSFINDFYHLTNINPSLFYETDREKSIELIIDQYVERK